MGVVPCPTWAATSSACAAKGLRTPGAATGRHHRGGEPIEQRRHFLVLAKQRAGRRAQAPADPAEGFVVQVERGYALEGRVIHVGTKEPVAGARVSLSIPPLDDSGANNVANLFGGFGGRGGRGGFGGVGGQDRLDETRTDGKGRFELRPLRAGTYVLRVDADGFPGYENTAFALGPGSAQSDIQLDPGARVYGTVLGLEAGKRVRLEFSHAETNERRTANVSRQDGSYEIEGLTSGGYFITLLDESNQGGGRGGRGGRERQGRDGG